eukprot:19070-Heterococcus_DN1.PRE.3
MSPYATAAGASPVCWRSWPPAGCYVVVVMGGETHEPSAQTKRASVSYGTEACSTVPLVSATSDAPHTIGPSAVADRLTTAAGAAGRGASAAMSCSAMPSTAACWTGLTAAAAIPVVSIRNEQLP